MFTLLIAGVDIIPVGWKLLSGLSHYEIDLWLADHVAAVAFARRRREWLADIDAESSLAAGVRGAWVKARTAAALAQLEAAADAAGVEADRARAEAGAADPAGADSDVEARFALAAAAVEAARREEQAARAAEDDAVSRLGEQRAAAARERARRAEAERRQAEAEQREAEMERQLQSAVRTLQHRFWFRTNVLDRAGQGGHIYAVEERSKPGRLYVLKLIATRLDSSLGTPLGADRDGQPFGADAAERLLREIARLRRKEHPNIVPLYEPIMESDFIGMLMPYYPDGDLGAAVRHAKTLTVGDVLRVGGDVAAGLAHLHAGPDAVMHRDIKPGNLFLDGQRTMIGDFGLARLADAEPLNVTRVPIATWEYAAPEQSDEDALVGTAADVRALGAVLYEMCTGQAPLRRERYVEDDTRPLWKSLLARKTAPMAAHLLNPAVPVALSELITSMLTYDPALRPTANEVLEDLRSLQRKIDSSVTLPFTALRAQSGWPDGFVPPAGAAEGAPGGGRLRVLPPVEDPDADQPTAPTDIPPDDGGDEGLGEEVAETDE